MEKDTIIITTFTPINRRSYDELYQLTSVDYNDGNMTGYSYDALGNRIDMNENGSITSYDVNSLNQYTSVDSVTYSYDGVLRPISNNILLIFKKYVIILRLVIDLYIKRSSVHNPFLIYFAILSGDFNHYLEGQLQES